MWEDAAANSVSGGGVDMPADAQHDKKKKKKAVYDGRTKEGKKFVEKMLARRKAKAQAQQVNASKQNVASVAMKEENIEESKELVDEAMSDKEKKKRLAMIKKSVERINSKNADKAKKDALAMMKASGMFDETVEEAKAPKIKGLSLYGSEITGLRQGMKTFSAKPVVNKGKLAYKVMDEFGGFETLDLKAFAKKFG